MPSTAARRKRRRSEEVIHVSSISKLAIHPTGALACFPVVSITLPNLPRPIVVDGEVEIPDDLRCPAGATAMTTQQLLQIVASTAPDGCTLVLTGGNPAYQPLASFIEQAGGLGYGIAVETDGGFPVDWFAKLDFLEIIPPVPSSGHEADLRMLDESADFGARGDATVTMRMVIREDRDLEYVAHLLEHFEETVIMLQPAAAERYGWLSERVLEYAAEDPAWVTVRVMP